MFGFSAGECGWDGVAHLNAGLSVTPSAHAPGGRTETALDASGGVGVIGYLSFEYPAFAAFPENGGHGRVDREEGERP